MINASLIIYIFKFPVHIMATAALFSQNNYCIKQKHTKLCRPVLLVIVIFLKLTLNALFPLVPFSLQRKTFDEYFRVS